MKSEVTDMGMEETEMESRTTTTEFKGTVTESLKRKMEAVGTMLGQYEQMLERHRT